MHIRLVPVSRVGMSRVTVCLGSVLEWVGLVSGLPTSGSVGMSRISRNVSCSYMRLGSVHASWISTCVLGLVGFGVGLLGNPKSASRGYMGIIKIDKPNLISLWTTLIAL